MMTRIRQLETGTQADRHTDSDRHLMCLPIIEGQSKNLNEIISSPHFPELKENQKRRFGQTAGPKIQLRNSITFKPRIELQRAQVEAAAQPAFCFYEATIIILHTA